MSADRVVTGLEIDTIETDTIEDRDLPRWASDLDIPGIFDVHVHFLPPAILRRVWEYFDAAGPLTGREWPITYRWSDEDRVAHLRSMGVLRWSSLPHAHKPDVANFLNDWAADFAATYADTLWSATFFPEPDAAAYVREGIAAGVELYKVHVQVGDFDPTDELLDEVWAALSESGTPVVIHAGSGPAPGSYTGPELIARVLDRHPQLPAIIAHMGMPEYTEFIELADRYANVCLDTTMAFTDFSLAQAPFPDDLRPRLLDLQHKILLGSDFPNIPYVYAHQIESLERLGLGDDWLRDVCWNNGARLFGRTK